MKILVTGATGKFGPYLIDALSAARHAPRVLVHNTPAVRPVVESVQGDVTSPADLDRALEGMDALCHLATVKGDREKFIPVNLGGLYQVLEAARRRPQAPQVILLSGDNVLPIFDYESAGPIAENSPYLFGDEEYGLSKILEETMALQYAKKYGLPVTVLRSSWIMEGQRAALLCHPRRGGWKKYLTAELLSKFERGENFRVVPHDKYGNPLRRHVIDPRDLAEAFVWALGNGKTFGELYNIAGPSAFDYRVLAVHLTKKDPQPVFDISAPDAYSFEMDLSKARAAGFTSCRTIVETVDWALNPSGGR